MKPEELVEQNEYKKMSKEKQAFIMDTVKSSAGLKGDAILPVLMKAQTKMKALNISFSKEETAFLMTALMSDLSPQEKARFDLLLKFMKHK